jgi:hypothetical protein
VSLRIERILRDSPSTSAGRVERTVLAMCTVPAILLSVLSPQLRVLDRAQSASRSLALMPLQGSFELLTASRMAELNTSRVAELNTSQMAELNTSRMAEMNTSQMAELNTSRMAELNTSRMAPLNTSRVAELNTSRMAPLVSLR